MLPQVMKILIVNMRMVIIDYAASGDGGDDDEDGHQTASGDDGVGSDTLWALPVLRPVTIN